MRRRSSDLDELRRGHRAVEDKLEAKVKELKMELEDRYVLTVEKLKSLKHLFSGGLLTALRSRRYPFFHSSKKILI